jgi:hypothetical protein
MIKAVQLATSVDWLYLIDSAGFVWERPLPSAGFDDAWALLPPLPKNQQATSMVVTPDGAVHVVTVGGQVYRYLADKWEDETPPFPKELS